MATNRSLQYVISSVKTTGPLDRMVFCFFSCVNLLQIPMLQLWKRRTVEAYQLCLATVGRPYTIGFQTLKFKSQNSREVGSKPS